MSDDLTERENRSRILSLLQLGGSHASNGDPVGAEAAFEEAAALARAAGLQEETECLYQLGSQRALRGAVSSARACFQEGLGIGLRAGLHQMAARHLVGLAELDDRESDEAGAFAHYACALIFLTTTDQDEYHLAVVVAQRVGRSWRRQRPWTRPAKQRQTYSAPCATSPPVAGCPSAVAVCLWGLLFLVFTPLALWAALVGLGVALVAYRFWVLSRAEVFADLVEAAFDLYRTTLYSQLRWPLPTDPRAERAVGRCVTVYLWRGLDDDRPTFTMPAAKK